jgi:CO dehydrogenase maturation factor
MAYIIALSGKGGTGKTTIAALTIKYLIEKKNRTVLAIDADSNSCLNEALGVEAHVTIGRLREESLDKVRAAAERPGGMSMEQLFDYQVQQALIESRGFDLMVMGRPEGPGCYCAANNIIRKYSDRLSEKYPYVVIDNEAGMEHLSRRTTHKVNLMLIVSDPTIKGIKTAERINNLIDELSLNIMHRVLIINRSTNDDFKELMKKNENLPFEKIIMLPEDSEVFKFDLEGRPVFEMSETTLIVKTLFKELDSLMIP